jgi:hypothetical protein
VANILRAEETGEALSEGKQLTAGELMQAIEDDPRDLRDSMTYFTLQGFQRDSHGVTF